MICQEEMRNLLHKDCNCTCLKLDIMRIIGDCWSRCFQKLDERMQDEVLNEAIEDAEKKADTYGQALLFTFENLCEDGAVSISGDFYSELFSTFVEDR